MAYYWFKAFHIVGFVVWFAGLFYLVRLFIYHVEAPTILLVAIVMLAIFKDNLPTDLTAWVIFAMIIAMAASIQLYARKRRLDKERVLAEIPQE